MSVTGDEPFALGLEEAWDLAEELKNSCRSVPKNLLANAKRTEAKWFKDDLIEIAIENTDLKPFLLGTGRLNRRKLARHIQQKLIERNQQPHVRSEKRLSNIGLRTSELVMMRWEESENS